MRPLISAFSVLLLSSTAFAQTAAPQYTALWSLGDSLTDVGRTGGLWLSPYPKGPLYYQNHFTNGNVWTEYLAQQHAIPTDKALNLAWGGAVTGSFSDKRLPTLGVLTLEEQVRQFREGVTGKEFPWYELALPGGVWKQQVGEQSAGAYGSKPLITVTIGGNNFRQYVEDGSIQNFFGLKNSITDEKNAILNKVPNDIRSLQDAISSRSNIAQSGATYYVWTIADVSSTPKFQSLSEAQRTELSSTVTETNRGLKSALYTVGDEFTANKTGSRIVMVDAAAFLAEVQRNPGDFGFKNAKDNCVASDTGKYTNGCNGTNVGDYLFWDEFHPTTKAHEMIAQYAWNTDMLEYGAPVSISLPYVANIEIRDRTFAGTIGGTGSMIKQGESTLTLAGLNSYSGGTRVDQGYVRVSTDQNLGARSGLLTLNGGGVSASASFAMQRNVSVVSSGTFQADPNVTLTLINNTLSGDGVLSKTGAGTLDLRSTMDTSANRQNLTTASSTVGRQLTSVVDGTLKVNTVNPYISYRIDVNDNATLAGSGTLTTTTRGTVSADGRAGGLYIGGMLAPGNSIGTLTINGDVTFTDSGRYQLEVDTDRSDHLVVNGSMTLDGQVVIVTDPTDKITTQSFTFATSAGALSGAYDGVLDLSPFLSETLSYFGNAATVQFRRDFAAPATTANQRAVAAHLNSAYRSTAQGDLDNVFYGLDTTVTNAAGANALDQLSGAGIGGLMTSDAIQRGQFTRAMEDRMWSRRSGRDASSSTAVGALSLGQDTSGLGGALQGASSAVAQAAPGQGSGQGSGQGTGTMDGVSAWARVMGGPSSVTGPGGYDMTGLGVMLGLDRSFGNGLIGASLSYGAFQNTLYTGGSGSADSYQGSVYGSWQQGNLFVDGTLAYAYVDYSSTRTLAFGNLSRAASGSANGNDVMASLKAGATFGLNAVAIEPSLGFDWYHLSRGGFTETNAGSAGLAVGAQDMDLVMPSIGLRLSSVINAATFAITPELNARYYSNFGDTGAVTTAGLIGAPAAPFTVEGTGLGRNIGVLSAGLTAQQDEHLRVSTRYELQFSNDVTAQVFAVDLKYRW